MGGGKGWGGRGRDTEEHLGFRMRIRVSEDSLRLESVKGVYRGKSTEETEGGLVPLINLFILPNLLQLSVLSVWSRSFNDHSRKPPLA